MKHTLENLKAFRLHMVQSTNEMLDNDSTDEKYNYILTMNNKTITIDNNADMYDNILAALNQEIEELENQIPTKLSDFNFSDGAIKNARKLTVKQLNKIADGLNEWARKVCNVEQINDYFQYEFDAVIAIAGIAECEECGAIFGETCYICDCQKFVKIQGCNVKKCSNKI